MMEANNVCGKVLHDRNSPQPTRWQLKVVALTAMILLGVAGCGAIGHGAASYNSGQPTAVPPARPEAQGQVRTIPSPPQADVPAYADHSADKAAVIVTGQAVYVFFLFPGGTNLVAAFRAAGSSNTLDYTDWNSLGKVGSVGTISCRTTGIQAITQTYPKRLAASGPDRWLCRSGADLTSVRAALDEVYTNFNSGTKTPVAVIYK